MVDLEFEGEKGAGGRLCDSGRRWILTWFWKYVETADCW